MPLPGYTLKDFDIITLFQHESKVKYYASNVVQPLLSKSNLGPIYYTYIVYRPRD